MTLAFLAEEYDAALAVVIAVVGWLASYWLGVRANNSAFLKQIENDARLEVTQAIREYQDWLGDIHALLCGLPAFDEIAKGPLGWDWKREEQRFRDLLVKQASIRWAARLEEYEILFAYTRRCRIELFDRHYKMTEALDKVCSVLTDQSADTRSAAIETAKKYEGDVLDQAALVDDLRVHLQNSCLGALTGRLVPTREPRDSSHPRLESDANGELRVVSGHGSTPAAL